MYVWVIIIIIETAQKKIELLYFFQNHLVAFNESAGILPNQDILAIKNVRQKSAGQYACSARNSEGETYSPPFDLTVQCEYMTNLWTFLFSGARYWANSLLLFK